MEKTQPIIEAEANLQVAKMLSSIDQFNISLIDFQKVGDYDLDKAINAIGKTQKLIIDVRDYLKKGCAVKELTIVNDVIKGIKLRSKYENEIKDLKLRLEKGKKLYNKAIENINTLKNITINSIIGKNLSKDERSVIIKKVKSVDFDAIIDSLMVEVQQCKTNENENPF